MKMLCYFVLGIALVMYYQKNPVVTGVVVVIFIAVYFFFKTRKSKGSRNHRVRTGMFSGAQGKEEGSFNTVMTLLALQQFTASSQSKPPVGPQLRSPESDELEREQAEVLAIFKEWDS